MGESVGMEGSDFVDSPGAASAWPLGPTVTSLDDKFL